MLPRRYSCIVTHRTRACQNVKMLAEQTDAAGEFEIDRRPFRQPEVANGA
jgi:hypothetical protein